MTSKETPSAVPPDPERTNGAIAATGWLGADGVYSHADGRPIGRAMTTSLALHGALFAALIAIFTVVPKAVFREQPLEFKVAFVPQPGPGGGGGGSPAPAPA